MTDIAARCIPTIRPPPVFQPRELLPWAAGPTSQIITGNVAVHTYRDELELYVTEPLLKQVVRLRGCMPNCSVELLSDGLIAPVRAQPVDFDADGDRDVLVADIGLVQARPDLVGRVVLLTDEGHERYRARVLAEGLGRVACAEAADLDGDHDLDVVVCEFGAEEGSVLWLERVASGGLVRHELHRGAGAIHAFPRDVDGDRDLDLVVALSQHTQAVVVFVNQGGGEFVENTIFRATSEGFGLSGIEVTDLDADGDDDVLVSGGDYLDDTIALAEQGVWWLEGDGHGHFAPHPIVQATGSYATHTIDVDGDCDRDILVARLLVADLLPAEELRDSGLFWLENDGAQHFSLHEIAGAPRQLATVSAFRRDGRLGIFTGSFTLGRALKEDQRLLSFWSRE